MIKENQALATVSAIEKAFPDHMLCTCKLAPHYSFLESKFV